ncbi:MAG TPA: calcium-binding protein [Solirubrobacteraceae bacterium]
MLRRTLLATTMALLVAAPAAEATVQARVSNGAVVVVGTEFSEVVSVNPSASSSPFPGRVRVFSGAGVTPGTNCAAESATIVHCTRQSVLRTDLLGGADRLSVTDSLRCDVCFLGRGADEFDSTQSQNDVVDGELDNDDLDAGPGTDTVLYTGRLNDVLIDLNGADNSGDRETNADGVSGNRDRLRNIEAGYGGGGNDTLVGTVFNNRFVGGAGSDTFIGGSGTDTVSYLPDVYDGTHLNRGVLAHIGGGPVSGQAIDRLTGPGDDIAADIENLQGGNNADHLIGDADRNSLVGNAGDDLIEPREGSDTVEGNDGTDTVSYAGRAEAVTLAHGAGTSGGPSDGGLGMRDTFLADVENFVGGNGDDTLTGNSGPNALDGGPGHDIMDGNGGLDTASYATRNEAVVVNLAATGAVHGGPLDGAPGNRDTLADMENATGGGGPDTLGGTSAVAKGTTGVNVLRGGPGDDVLDGAGGSDDLFGDLGADTASYATRGTAVVAGASGSTSAFTNGNGSDGAAGARDRFTSIENLRGGSAADTLTGDNAENRLEGGAGGDALNGSSADDTLVGGPGADAMNGGTGIHDAASYDDRTTAVTARLATNDVSGNADDGSAGARDDIAADVEDLVGGGGDDTLTGTDGPNLLRGGNGNDTLAALGGADRLEGGSQDDVLTSGPGSDVLVGEGGSDTASYSDRGVPITATLSTPSGNGEAGESDNFATDIEKLAGGSAGDRLTGSSGPNTLTGNGGDDTLDGAFGADTLQGGPDRDVATYENRATGVTATAGAAAASGNANDGPANARDTITGDVEVVRGTPLVDTLIGAAGAQTLQGLGGNDVLDGAGGNDTLDGGEGGADVADYSARTAPLSVRLGVAGASGNADDGAAGTRDSLETIEDVRGGSADDVLTGDSAANRLEGRGGNDTMDGGAGADALVGGEGARDVATYALRTGTVVARLNTAGQSGTELDGASGARDSLDGTTEGVRGGSGDDQLFGANRTDAELLQGLGGADTLDGGSGPDEIDGGDGTDTVSYATRPFPVTVKLDGTPTSGNGDDGPTAGARDTVAATVENIDGGTGSDTLTGSGAVNRLAGGGGDDVLDGGIGADVLAGGGGSDAADYRARTTAVRVELGGVDGASGNAADGPAGARDDVEADVERALGGSGNDTLLGSAGGDVLSGGDGNDTLDGRAGPDAFLGGPGAADAVLYTSRTTPVRAVVDGGPVSGDATDELDTNRDSIQSDVENLAGGTAGDEMIGGASANRLDGGGGDDTLQGLGGADTLIGGTGPEDLASYAERTTPVFVRIGGGRVSGDETDGPAGARDDVQASVNGVIGGSAGDDLAGTAAADRLVGGPGPDTLRGLASKDTLLGEGGDDTLDGGFGADEMQGGDGTDTATYEARTTAVTATLDGTSTSGTADDGPAGSRDRLFADIENLTGGSAGDTLTGSPGENRLDGRDGGDTLTGAGAADVLLGGRDPDTMRGGSGADALDGGGAADDMQGGDDRDLVTYASRASAVDVKMGVAGASGNADDGAAGSRDSIAADVEDLEGTSDDDTLAGGATDNTIDGREGADVIRGLGGLDTITYEDRPDPVIVALGVLKGSGNDVDGPPGSRDTVEVDVERIVGTEGDDQLTGSPADNVLEGNLGADDLAGLGGTDTVTYEQRPNGVTAAIGGSGGNFQDDDGSRRDAIATDVENLTGGSGDDVLTGDSGSDAAPADSGANVLRGGAGDDTLAGGEDPDRFVGGDGTDTVTYAGSAGGVVAAIGLTGASGNATDGTAGARDTIDGDVENLIGSPQQDELTGSTGANRIEGLDGADELNGRAGADTLLGGSGTDALDGGFDPDVLSGGTGPGTATTEADIVTYEARTAGVTAEIGTAGASGNASDGSTGARDTIQGDVERLVGGLAGDQLIGSDAANRLTGNGGPDTIAGREGDDTLVGGAGLDTLFGGDDQDVLEGGADADALSGGAADDELSGGDGGDTIEGGDGDDRLPGGLGDDTLRGDAGLDSLFGEGGNDLLDGGIDRDVSSGGPGIDRVTYATRSDPVTVTIGAEFASGNAADDVGGQRDTVNTDVENVDGGAGGDTLTGNADPNRLAGNGGDDHVFGGTGADTLIGGDGADELDGEADGDDIRGDAGSDVLIGGFGIDALFGGADDDDVRIREGTQDTASCGDGPADTVTADAIDSVDGTCETVSLP